MVLNLTQASIIESVSNGSGNNHFWTGDSLPDPGEPQYKDRDILLWVRSYTGTLPNSFGLTGSSHQVIRTNLYMKLGDRVDSGNPNGTWYPIYGLVQIEDLPERWNAYSNSDFSSDFNGQFMVNYKNPTSQQATVTFSLWSCFGRSWYRLVTVTPTY